MKITINNEEVLCNKDFTINEEMLNTSSVILNNVYPKTWEEDKNYVSRFYYPKDYSKCKIFNEIEHPEEKSTAEGTSFSINVDTTKEYQVQTLKGQTTQTGTPTPTSPQPINITTGRQVVSVSGKNLLNPNAFVKGRIDLANGQIQHPDSITSFTTTNNSISFTSNATWRGVASDFIPIETGTYYFKMSVSTTSSNVYAYVDYYDSNYNYISRLGNNGYVNGDTKTWTLNLTEQNARFIRIHFQMQQIGTTTITNPMLDDENATYEEYKGNDYEINLGKQLLNLPDRTATSNGISYSCTDGTITLNNTATANSFINAYTSQTALYLDAGTYTLSANNPVSAGGSSGQNVIRIMKSNGSDVVSGSVCTMNTINASTTFTITEAMIGFMQIRTQSGTSYTDFIIKPQLEKGIGTSYSPYKTPIYLGRIGTYQDYIFRNTTENPLYDSNLEEGQWYLHKEIGRVVLNGSEPFQSYTEGFTITESNWNNLTNNNCMSKSIILSNYYKNYTTYADFVAQNYGISLIYSVNNLYIRNTDITSVANFKTWLSTHNVEVYYVLNTPTNTLIEDEELINQLNAIELLEGLNNVSITSPNLPFIMSLMYNYQEGYTEEELYFCGIVKNTGEISLNPRHPHYCNIQVLDFKDFLSQGETLDFVITEKTIGEAIEQVIGTIAPYGFIKGNILLDDIDELMGTYSTKDKTAYDVFNYIADITQSRWTTRMVDENTIAIDFFDPNKLPLGEQIEYNQTWFRNHKIDDLSYSYSSNDYRNKQVMLSGEVYSNIETTEILVADGYQTQFNTIDKIGKVSSLLLNGTPVSIITKEEYDLGYDADFYYQPGNKYFESVNLVSTGAILTIVYYAIIEGREVILNQEEINLIEQRTGRKGIVARYENRNDATTTGELQAIGQSYLEYKGIPEIKLNVSSRENTWNIGDRVYFNAPLDELKQTYMVKAKKIQRITTIDELFYQYELTSSFNMEQDINYFDNQRYKSRGNIGEGEFISRNIDIENTANVIFYDLEVEEVEVEGNNTLQSELQSVLGGVE